MREFGDICQLGYVVADVDASVDAWSKQLDVGPWTIFRNVTLTCLYHGNPSAPRIDVALGYRGAMQIELIQQKNTSNSPYRRMIEQQNYGLHHTAFLSDAIDDDIERGRAVGLEPVCDIQQPDGTHYAYLQSSELGEHIYLELLGATDALKRMFQQGVNAAAHWDGSVGPTEIDMQT